MRSVHCIRCGRGVLEPHCWSCTKDVCKEGRLEEIEALWKIEARLRDENEQMKQVLLVEQTALRNQEARERAK